MNTRAAALFVSPDGPYMSDPRFDPWPEARDARRYAGNLPIIAHPPCNTWSIAFAAWAGKPGRPEFGQDGGCFASAIENLARVGGVLEHPARSRAWPAFGLPVPAMRWSWQYDLATCLWVTEIDQIHFGHTANKPTWLLYAGRNPPEPAPPERSIAGRKVADLHSSKRIFTPLPMLEWLASQVERV